MADDGREALLDAFERTIGHLFSDRDLLEQALTHASFANEQGLPGDNERLEYLGDAVLELAVSERLYAENPEFDEGDLTTSRSRWVCEKALAEWARDVGLDRLLKLGKGLDRQGGRSMSSVLSDGAEAVFGAVHCDAGFDAARRVVGRYLDRITRPRKPEHPKSTLQEELQSRGYPPPEYRMVERVGPEHSPEFHVEASLYGRIVGRGTGASIKRAERSAAEEALNYLRGVAFFEEDE
jgi:ribonuclease-3